MSKIFHRYQSHSIFYLLELARTLIKMLKERNKSINVWINNRTKVKKTLALTLLLVLIAGLEKTYSRLST